MNINELQETPIGQRQLEVISGVTRPLIRSAFTGKGWPQPMGSAIRHLIGFLSNENADENAIDPIQAKARKDQADAVLKEMQIEEKRGQLCHRATILNQWVGIANAWISVIERSKLTAEEKKTLRQELDRETKRLRETE